MAATANRGHRPMTGNLPPVKFDQQIAASARVFAGTLVAMEMDVAGRPARPAAADLDHMVIGFAQCEVDNSAVATIGGADGKKRVPVLSEAGWVDNSAAADQITTQHIGLPCYVVDDKTVALTSNSDARPIAGIICDVDSAKGVLVYAHPFYSRRRIFTSTEQTGNGGAQSVAHKLGVVPRHVIVVPTELPDAAAETGFDIAEGAHTDANVVVTVTSTVKYKILAFA